ncbi:hypothetical protein GCM10009789_11730 [Kribbella sancticallisti]|uniref:ABC transporter domain-containing protein n=1 Tax=Kribbella sancticallisti TaxID=460087 RepID=A0ABP4NFY4_9ACTN
MVLVGPSGSGKSTALWMLAGLEEVNAGVMAIGDRDVTNAPPKDRDIAMVFQNYALYPHMTVADNMGLALKMQGIHHDERALRVREQPWHAEGVLDQVRDGARVAELTGLTRPVASCSGARRLLSYSCVGSHTCALKPERWRNERRRSCDGRRGAVRGGRGRARTRR